MIAIIPARGGSKGLPGKNTRDFCGKPLIAISIEQALASKHIERVIVSTDDDHIAEVARAYGAEVPFMRPEHLASDTSPALDTYLYTIERLNAESEDTYDSFIVLLPTAPLRSVANIDSCIELFDAAHADSVISITESPTPIEWTRCIDEKGILRPYFEEGNKNRQEYSVTYVPNGQLYVFRYKALKATRQYYTDGTLPFITSSDFYGDIDTLDDFEITAFKYLRLKEKGML